MKELMQNASLWSQVLWSIMVANAWGIIVKLQMDTVKWFFLCKKYNWCFPHCIAMLCWSIICELTGTYPLMILILICAMVLVLIVPIILSCRAFPRIVSAWCSLPCHCSSHQGSYCSTWRWFQVRIQNTFAGMLLWLSGRNMIHLVF